MPYQKRETDQDVLIAEGAVVTGNVTLGRGVNIWYYAVLRGDWGLIQIGENTNIQDHCAIHEETTVGSGCTVGHGAILHGCTVGNNTLVGMGSVLLNGARIGNNCLVGAGALVSGKMDAPDGSLILGNPARVIRSLTPEEIEFNREEARSYLAAAETYRRS